MWNFFKKKSDRAPIVPRIRGCQFAQAAVDAGIPEEQRPLMRAFVADLSVAYAFDEPDQFRFVRQCDLDELKIPIDLMHEQAVTQLESVLPEVGIEQKLSVFKVGAGEDHDTCMMLLPSFWNDIAAQLQADPIVAAPHTRLLVFGAAESDECIEQLRWIIGQTDFSTPQALSEELFVWRDQKWSVHAG